MTAPSTAALANRVARWADQVAEIASAPATPNDIRQSLCRLANAVRETADGLAQSAAVRTEQRRSAAKCRVKAEAERNGPVRARALRLAQLLRAATPWISQGDIADQLLQTFQGDLPKRDALIKRIRTWERAGELVTAERSLATPRSTHMRNQNA